jgi:ribonuclease HI
MSSLFVPGNSGRPTASKSNSVPSASIGGAVVYVDGGSRPNPGFGGLGIHGYIYTMDEPKRGSGCKKGVPTTRGYMAKGSVKEKPITIVKYIDGFGAIKHGTNQTAEQHAAIAAITKLLEIREEFAIGRVVMLADSKYVVDGISQWVLGWEANGWKKSDGSEIANLDIWKKLYSLVRQLEDFGVTVEWLWVKGHDGDIGNSKADYFATCGVITAKKQLDNSEITVSEAQGYWTQSIPYNRLLTHTKCYFNTNTNSDMRTPDGLHVYYLGNHGKDDEMLGKRISDARFSVLMLEHPVTAFETVRKFQDGMSASGEQKLVIARLDNILQAENHMHLAKYGDMHLDYYGRNRDVGLPPRGDEEEGDEGDAKYFTPLTKVLMPPRLAQNAVEILVTLEAKLTGYRVDPAEFGICVTDITNILYELETTKKAEVCKLKPHINSSMKSIEVDVNYDIEGQKGSIPVILTLDIDTPDRNALAAIADTRPKVSVISWAESLAAFRYAVVVESGKDIGIWAGVYSNFKVLPKAV